MSVKTVLNTLRALAPVALAAVAATSIPAFAQVTLNVGDNVVVTAINGQEVKTSMFRDPVRTFTLEPGQHVITAKYQRLYDLRGDEHDILRSDNISIPVELQDNRTYTLVMANQPEAYRRAKDYAKKPTLALVDSNSQTIASQQAQGSSDGGIFSGLGSALGGIFGGHSNAVESNQQTINALEGKSGSSIPALAPQANPAATNGVAVTSNATATTSTNVNANANMDTLDQFMNLWLKATPAEREKIRQWVQR